MRVVFSESCPIASLITDKEIFLLLAMLAQAWRATYVVKGIDNPNRIPSFSVFDSPNGQFSYTVSFRLPPYLV